ncbi:MAG: FHA domain-containing protein [Planctomycetota bacterium]|jgi:pSer/pThr/pTyr-binding forkhead associated (FHA) protein
MAKLLILTGKHQGKRLSLPERDVIVGRSEECNITLKTEEVSRQHCILRFQDGQLTVRDLESRNGTLVNGTDADRETPLKDGDELQIGPMRFRVQLAVSATATPGQHATAGKGRVDEDNIASWLAENPDDTHTIKAATDEDTAIHTVTGNSTVPKKVFSSVAEEAQYIIRRHLEAKAESPHS